MDDSITEETFKARLSSYSLSELEDVLAHIDRDLFPERERLVTQAIESRLAQDSLLAATIESESAETSPSLLRRVSQSLIDLSIQVVIPYIVLYFVVKVIYTPLGKNQLIQYLFPPQAQQRGARRGRGGRSNDVWSDISGWLDSFYGFVGGVISREPEAVSMLIVVGEYFAVYLLFRMVWTSWRLSRSGATSGMQETGIRMLRTNGQALTFPILALRFVVHHVLFFMTLGLSGLWMLWDKEKRALHDRILGVKLIRVARSWEKTDEARKLD